jgi:hypothetical protein
MTNLRILSPEEPPEVGNTVNTEALEEAEAKFLKKYPGGFRHPDRYPPAGRTR